MNSRMCPICKRRFVNKRQYKVIRKYCGSNNIIPELYIMEFRDEKVQTKIGYERIERPIAFEEVDRNKFFIVENESNICPIHNCRMEIKVINFGMKQKDTVHYCKRCNKNIISRKQYDFLKNQCIHGGKRIMHNAKFEELL